MGRKRGRQHDMQGLEMNESRRFMDGRSLVAEFDIRPTGIVYRNPEVESLYQAAIQTGQAKPLSNGALWQDTTPYFGRAAKSSFYVHDKDARFDGKTLDDLIAWGNPRRMNTTICRSARCLHAASTTGNRFPFRGGRSLRNRCMERPNTGVSNGCSSHHFAPNECSFCSQHILKAYRR